MHPIDSKIFMLLAPTISALVALLIIFFDVLGNGKKQRRPKIILILYLACTAGSSGLTLIYFYNPELFMWLNGLLMFCFMSMPVFLYAFIHAITQTDKPQNFSNYHYAMPVILTLLLIVAGIITPAKDQLNTITSLGAYHGGSKFFFILSDGKLFYRFLFSIVYIWLSFRRLPAYRAYITSYSANETKSSLHWVSVYLFFMVCLIPIPLFGLFIPRNILFAFSALTILHISLMVIQHSFLSYHIVKGHYILEDSTVQVEKFDDIQKNENNETVPLLKNTLTTQALEHYMLTQKPYLNPELKITDMVVDLNINRTYISTFINSEYDMNFSTFVNQYRLNEYQQLRLRPDLQNKTNMELVEQAGFGSYRSYLRFAEKIDGKDKS